ncbi:MAG: succinyldiaminopimelate transaminase, partial [Thermobifida sp.]|nr:succinyldiaminopimelate transaminase [Thermobifida sp.]
GLGDDEVIPIIGSKESVALLPLHLGVRPDDLVLHPRAAYPTYDVGARLVGATPVPVDTDADPDTWGVAEGTTVAVVWLNSPGNPDGHVMSKDELRAVVAWARAHGAVVVSDECYAALPWSEPYVSEGVPSLLDTDVCDGDASGLLVLYSLSKQSNLAGYRGALIYGDPALVAPIVSVRKHSGLMVPAPVQHAMAVALHDTEHVERQRSVYAVRRALLLEALTDAGLDVDPDTAAGLYLWVLDPAHPTDSWALVNRLADLGILVAPGDFYGTAAHGRVRVALTATDERIQAAASRIREAWTAR